MARKSKVTEIKDSDIRIVIYMLKTKHSKKECCEKLRIAYNVKRLDKIIDDFKVKEQRIKELKSKRSKNPFTEVERKSIVKDYNDGEAMSGIAEQLYASPQRIKNVLIEMNVPIRARSKKGVAKTDHVVQDLDVILTKKDRVFVPKINSFGSVEEVYDEDWLYYYRNPENTSYVELHGMKTIQKDAEEKEDTHWNTYYTYSNGQMWKQHAMIEKIRSIERTLEETGRERYKIWIEGDNCHWSELNREDIIPMKGS